MLQHPPVIARLDHRGEPAHNERRAHDLPESSMTPAARALADWAGTLRPSDVPAAVMDNATLRVLDTIGCALAGAREEHVPAVLALASRWSAGGPSPIWGKALTGATPQAALANGAIARGLDFR